jgi:hypothetical protein
MNKDHITLLLLMIVFCLILAALLIGIGYVMSHYLIYLLDTALPVLELQKLY